MLLISLLKTNEIVIHPTIKYLMGHDTEDAIYIILFSKQLLGTEENDEIYCHYIVF